MDTMTASPPEAQPLTDEDLLELGGSPETITSIAEMDSYLFLIRKKEEEKTELERRKKEAQAFYDERIDRQEQTIEFLTAKVQGFVRASGENSITTPTGRAGFRTRKKFRWGSTDDLLAFAKERGLEVKVTETPRKRAIKAFFKETGELPSGTEVEEVTSFHVSV